MGSFLVSLPTFLPLENGRYDVSVNGVVVSITVARREQAHLDPRLGIERGNFGLQSDPVGLLRYTELQFELNDEQVRAILKSAFGDRFATHSLTFERKIRVLAETVSSVVIDRFRAFSRDSSVPNLRSNPLLFALYNDENTVLPVKTYGGGFTLPVAGLGPERLGAFQGLLLDENPIPTWLIAILDARHLASRGQPGPALISALGALEAALNTFFNSKWRGAERTTPQEAVRELNVRQTCVTIDDVLRVGGLWQKVSSYADTYDIDQRWLLALDQAIDARNDAVHGGITVPERAAVRHINAIARFLEEQEIRVFSGFPMPAEPRVLDSFRELTGEEVPEVLSEAVARYLVPHGLDVIIYSDGGARPKGEISDQYDRTLVAWMLLRDRTMTPSRHALNIARLSVEFSLRYQGWIPLAQVGRGADNLGGGYSDVGWALTQTAWQIGVDKRLTEWGGAEEITRDVERRIDRLRAKFGGGYEAPVFGTVEYFIAHAELTRIAAAVSAPRARRLLDRVAVVNREVATRARECLELVAAVDLNVPESLRDALIILHDVVPLLGGSVVVFDPQSGQLHGLGLVPNPQPRFHR